MGIYLYSIRAKTHRLMLPDGNVIDAHEMKFLLNGGSFFILRASDRILQSRAEQYWAGKMLPKYVVLVGEKGPEAGDRVFEWKGSGPCWVDCESFPGEEIGEVLEVVPKIGLRVGPHVCRPFADCVDPETGQDVCACGNRFGPERVERTSAHLQKIQAEAAEKAAREMSGKQE